jgi:hypothetical protein
MGGSQWVRWGCRGGGDCQEPIVGAGRVTHLHSTQHFRKISNFFHKLFREFFQYLFPFHFNPTSSLILPPWHSIYLTNLSALILCPTLYTALSSHVLSFTIYRPVRPTLTFCLLLILVSPDHSALSCHFPTYQACPLLSLPTLLFCSLLSFVLQYPSAFFVVPALSFLCLKLTS